MTSFLDSPLLLAQNLESTEFWGKNHGFEGKILGSGKFPRVRKIPDPRFQNQIADPKAGSGMSDWQRR